MSYYKGNVVKLTWLGQFNWEVVSVYYLDTNCDDNVHTSFMHNSDARVVIIPSTSILNFDPVTTKKVINTVDVDTGMEHWAAIK